MEFKGFPKIARLNREIIITEKIDGTNAQIFIDENNNILTGSRTRWITTKEDNYGFAAWVEVNKEDLLKLGPGAHFGEWYGKGIQHGYSMKEKRFALFNTHRCTGTRPICCDVVPILYQGLFSETSIKNAVERLRTHGSALVPGFMRPEGIIVYHTAANISFKIILVGDESYKGVSK